MRRILTSLLEQTVVCPPPAPALKYFLSLCPLNVIFLKKIYQRCSSKSIPYTSKLINNIIKQHIIKKKKKANEEFKSIGGHP